MKNLVKKWWFGLIIIFISILFVIGIFGGVIDLTKNSSRNYSELQEIEQLINNGELEKAQERTNEYIEKNKNKAEGYLKYADICLAKQEYTNGISKLIIAKNNVMIGEEDKQKLENKQNELEEKEKESKEKEKEQIRTLNEQKSKQQEEKDKIYEERYNEFDNILKKLYPYGYKIGFGEYIQINKTDSFEVYGGNIKIENEFGNKVNYPYTVRYSKDGIVEEIVVNSESVYKI